MLNSKYFYNNIRKFYDNYFSFKGRLGRNFKTIEKISNYFNKIYLN